MNKPLIVMRVFQELPPKERDDIIMVASRQSRFPFSRSKNGQIILDDNVISFFKASDIEVIEDEGNVLFQQGQGLCYSTLLSYCDDEPTISFTHLNIP